MTCTPYLLPRTSSEIQHTGNGLTLIEQLALRCDRRWIAKGAATISGLHNLGKPIVADHLGGLVGFAALCFGAVSSLAAGIGEKERFDGRGWHKEPAPLVEDAKFGRSVRVSIPGLHRSVTLKELDVLASAKNGRRLCGCNDRSCCQHGYIDMVADPRGHAARQLFRAISAIEEVPDLRRDTHFLDGPLVHADRRAREIKGLRPSQAEAERHGIDGNELMKRLLTHSRHVEKLRSSLEHIHEARGDEGPRARPIEFRTSFDQRSNQKPT